MAAHEDLDRRFQSTPVIADERIASIDKRMMRGESFQSTPVIADERIW